MISTMLSIITGVLVVAWALFAFVIGYLLLLTFAAATKRRVPPPARDWRTFRIIVPAHNAELVLAPVLQRLSTLHYPRTHYQIVVVADNCADDTVGIARSYGARVVDRFEPHACSKSHALAAAFAMLRNERFDAYVILDADTLADETLLQILNRYLAAGHRVIQAHHDVLDPHNNQRTALMVVALRILRYVRPLGRRALGGNATLTGNGMCLRKDVIERYPWHAFSLADEMEHTSTLVRDGQQITFAPEAKIAAPMPTGRTPQQRMGWEGGQTQNARRDGLRFLLGGLVRRNWRWFDWGMELLIPPLAALARVVVTGTAAALALVVIAPSTTTITVWCMWLALAGALAVFVLDAMLVGGAPWAAYRAILSAPGYMVGKLWAYIVLATDRRPQHWARTRRTRINGR